MDNEAVIILTDALKEYYNNELELIRFCSLYDINIETYDWNTVGIDSSRIDYSKMSQKLIIESESGNNRRFLDDLIPSLITRCKKYISETEWHKRDYHENMHVRLAKLHSLIGAPELRHEITVSEGRPFFAKSEVREHIEKAKTEVTIVDPYIGVGTLDCLREVGQSIRILTGERSESIEEGFDLTLKDFRCENRIIEIRRHQKLHDRFLIFNDRCWLVGSSLKDAGKKTFNIIECVDIKEAILEEIERKWKEGYIYPPVTNPA